MARGKSIRPAEVQSAATGTGTAPVTDGLRAGADSGPRLEGEEDESLRDSRWRVGLVCVFAIFFRGADGRPAACRNSAKLNLSKASSRPRSGTACTSPLKPK